MSKKYEINEPVQVGISKHDIQHGIGGFLALNKHDSYYINIPRALATCKTFSTFWEKIHFKAYEAGVKEFMQN